MSKEITVFVSHSHRDIDIAEKMCEYLHQKGLTCWISSRNIPGGKWPDYVMHGINNCDVFVLIYSKYSNESGNVENEVINAAKTDALLIPFCLDSSEMNATLTLHLTKYEKVVVGNAPLEQKFDELYQKIADAMADQNLSLYHFDEPESRQSASVRGTDVNYPYNADNEVSVNNSGRRKPHILAISIVVLAFVIFAAYAAFSNRSSDNTESDDSETVITEEIIEETAEEEVGEEIAEEAIEEEIAVTEIEDTVVEQEEEEIEKETTVAIDVPDDAVEYNGHYYLLYEVGSAIDWEDAKERCEKLGGHLATITSAAEQAFLETNVLDSNGTAWLGGYYDTDGVWRWCTNEVMVYTKWTQPSHTSSSTYRYMGIVGYNWHYYDETGYYKNSVSDYGQVTSYICEWDYAKADEEDDYGIEGAKIPDDAIEYNGHYYRIYKASSDLTWDEAESLCETLGGHLATITSSAEQEYLTRNVLVNGESYFLGACYNTDGDWVWVTGEAMGYIQWTIPSPTTSSTYRYMGINSYSWHYYNETGYYEDSFSDYDQTNGYLCEWDSDWSTLILVDTETDETETSVSIPDDVIEYNGHSYRIYSTSSSMTWEYAETLCEGLGGHLLTITSEEEENFLEINVFQNGVNYMIGGYYNTSGNWAWITGEEMDYQGWEFPSQTTASTYRYLGIKSYEWHYFNETGYYKNSVSDYAQTSGFICEWDTTADAVAAAEAE